MGESGAAEPTEDEVRGWFTPHQAVALLGSKLDLKTARQAIITRLRNEMFRSYALNFVFKTGEKVISRGGLVVIDAKFWAEHHDHIAYRFWDTGDVEFEIRNSSNRALFFDIRFETSGIEAIAPRVAVLREQADTLPASETVGQPARKPIAPAELDRFGSLMRGVYPEITEARATRIVRAMFPDFAISRDQIRALLPPRRPGRPASREKNGE